MIEKEKKFQLEDLSPRSCFIELQLDGDENSEPIIKRYRLRKFTLRTQIWIREEFGTAKHWGDCLNPLSEVNKNSDSLEFTKALCKTLHHLIEDKSDFPTWEDFADVAGAGPAEMKNLETALLVTLGISQALIDKVESAKKKVNSPTEAKKKPVRTGTK